jgi:8-oxo-dGTP diphosphatase
MNLLKYITYKETFTADMKQYKSVRVVLLDDENLVAVLYIGKVNFYTLPGGSIEKGETPEQAAIRETQEETGCDSEILCTLGIIEENSKTCDWNGINTCFLSKIKGKKGIQNLTQIESEEETQIRWYSLLESLKIITNQEINARNEREIGIGKIIQERDITLLNEVIQKKLIETKLYFNWVQRICTEKNIKIIGRMTHVKDGKLFCVSSNIGDLYLKKTTSFIIDELTFTLKLMELGIINLPEWIGYDHDMNVCLMRNMGGSDLSLLPTLEMETSLNMFTSLSRLQKDSIQYVKSEGFYGFDYRIGTMLAELEDLPESAYKMLSDTQYRITRDEVEKLKRNAKHITALLESIKKSCLPDTIHHGDLGTYNVRIIDGKCIFYDWGCGGVSHPFFDTFRLLSSIRGKLPTDVAAKEMIIDTYLGEWLEYGSYKELKNIFMTIDGLAGFYMAYVKYIRARNLHITFTNKPEAISADGLGLDMRYSTAATYLKRFITNDF